MATIKVNLVDDDKVIETLITESDHRYVLNDYFDTDDGGVYLVSDVRRGSPPIDIELDALWIDGQHPTPRVE